MRVLITGNLGYVGPVLARHLRKVWPKAFLAGFDCGFFAHCLTGPLRAPETHLDVQFFGDVRTLSEELLKGFDGVVHLAAISNDPMGNQFEEVTLDINWRASVRLAEMAKKAGVSHFVFASSCSVYGFATEGARTETSSVDPLTAYARSKVFTERDLMGLASDGFQVTCLRFATACGFSDRLRLDLVLNDFVAAALASRKITILSDGTPWRPLIHVEDMARAIEWALTRPSSSGGDCLVINTGSNEWNYQVKALAEAVATSGQGTEVSINSAAPPDRRSYRVNFDLYQKLAPDHQPSVTLSAAVENLRGGLEKMGFNDPDFRNSPLIRLNTLRNHLTAGRLTPALIWA